MGSARFAWELCRAALADGDGLAVMLKIYMDESGTHDGSPVVSVSAYSARPKTWQEFTKRWNVAKRPIGVFHSTDCEALRSEFKGWSAEQRNELVARLLPTLDYADIRGIAVAINMNDFNAVAGKNDLFKRAFGSAYATCFQMAVHAVFDEVERIGIQDQIAFFHEDNDYEAEALSAFNFAKSKRKRHKSKVSITFAPKDKFVPLQAADVLAFESNKRARNQSRPARRSLTAMDPRGERLSLRIIDKSKMESVLKNLLVTIDEVSAFGYRDWLA